MPQDLTKDDIEKIRTKKRIQQAQAANLSEVLDSCRADKTTVKNFKKLCTLSYIHGNTPSLYWSDDEINRFIILMKLADIGTIIKD